MSVFQQLHAVIIYYTSFICVFKQPKFLLTVLNNNKEIIKGITKYIDLRCGCWDTLISGKEMELKNVGHIIF